MVGDVLRVVVGVGHREWRSGAVFEREEVIHILTTPEIPVDRRVFYAVAALSGMRLGEIAGLRWRHLRAKDPLDRLMVAHSYDGPTKTDIAREVPVHPMFQRVLKHWRHVVYEASIGSTPGVDDRVLPRPLSATRLGAGRTKNSVGKAFARDLARLDLRHRRFHDFPRTFISLARQDGARRDHLERVTHTPCGRAAIDLYTSVPWVSKCEAVANLRSAKPNQTASYGRSASPSCYVRATLQKKPAFPRAWKWRRRESKSAMGLVGRAVRVG